MDRGVDMLTPAPGAMMHQRRARAQRDRAPVEVVVIDHLDIKRGQPRPRRHVLEQLNECEMGDDAPRTDSHGVDVARPDIATIAFRGIIALGLGQFRDKRLERRLLTELADEIHGPGGIPHHLYGLEAGEVVEETTRHDVNIAGVCGCARAT